jgi:ubiquinone/menaquinone biosynthesis C-methylase UbiE
MEIFEEYLRQQAWRNWPQYLNAIPLTATDRVVDLGCSVGAVSRLLAGKVEWVTGVDANSEFINYCLSQAQGNQNFICTDFTNFDYSELGAINGLWASFTISYLQKPREFLAQLYKLLQPGGWIAVVDVAGFVSGNMLSNCKYFNLVKNFEVQAYKSGVYDFEFGEKMEPILRQLGFKILHLDNDVTDVELNFNGAADAEILRNWQARLARMQGLRNAYPAQYAGICEEVLASLQSVQHRKNRNLRFVVAQK